MSDAVAGAAVAAAGPGQVSPGALADRPAEAPVTARDTVFRGLKWDVVAEDVVLDGGGPRRREFVRHPGAVSVLAVDGEQGAERVLLIRQYRHPVRMDLWELPAGLLDEPGEDPAAAAARELAEEADLEAAEYRVLVDHLASPGGSDEAHRVYLARGLRPVPPGRRHVRTEEEAGIVVAWVPLDDAVDAVLAGHVQNAGAVVGLLAAAAARARGWSTLRPADAPWPEHPAHRPR
ncbi:MAG: NUDIX domain-containing protein [Kineosporiaceae bacterium]